MSWIQDIINPDKRKWEPFYRARWQHDNIVRSTHGVNCTGGCSWRVYVKCGVITWEMQQVDYPKLEKSLPPYEPRGCQRGISASWYVYSPIRVRYPYIRGALIDLWRQARKQYDDPVEAWGSIVNDPDSRKTYQQARGKGGFRRSNWQEVLEIISAANVHTIKKYGPDRIVGFSPIPAMSQLSFAAGSRFLNLAGGHLLSFYDWYSDLPPAEPEVWGEQTDAHESADWYNAKFIVSMGSNLNMTRTPDVHFIAEARHNGSKFVVFAPDFSQVAKYSDWWIPVHAGQDGAFWMAVNHVILTEYYVKKATPSFDAYMKQFTDSPFLVVLNQGENGYEAGRLLRANTLARYQDEENGEWKFLMFDETTGAPKMPKGTMGHRWQEEKKGQWNLELKDGLDDSPIAPLLSFIDNRDEVYQVQFEDFSNDNATVKRGVPVKYLETSEGKVAVTTIFDLMMAHFGVNRDLGGEYPNSYEDTNHTFTPAWQEQFTGIDKATVINFANQFATTAEKTGGKCTVIIGAGINHWYHNNLMYRGPITALMLCGCVGKNGGGLAHYVGQEKLAPISIWKTVAMATDWAAPRLQNAPTWHYIHCDQWRYEGPFAKYASLKGDNEWTGSHAADINARAVRMGWLPFYPQFERSSLEIVKDAEQAGASTEKEVVQYVVNQLKERKLRFAAEDPDNPKNWPRVWYIWRGNAIMASGKGHEYFLHHYLGTHTNKIAEEQVSKEMLQEMVWRDETPVGKMDLVVDINFRMDTSALYSDIVLPTAHWYEKNDINTTDMHSFVHPLSEAVAPNWEARTDWNIYKSIAKGISDLADKHLPEPMKDFVCTPLEHDYPDELAQPSIKDWAKGECEPIPGKTMPKMKIVVRDYKNLYNQFISFGPQAREKGLGAHGVHWDIDDMYDGVLKTHPTVQWNGQTYPSLTEVVHAINIILRFAPETNGESAYRAFQEHEKKVGLPLADLGEGNRQVTMTFEDIQQQPRRILTSPCWSGIVNDGRAYSPFCMSVDRLVPWRTLTGRQHFYLDHEGYLAFGEHLPTYKPKANPMLYGDFVKTQQGEPNSVMLNYLTPHGKWHIHSTYYDNHRMLTLSRGIEPFWLNPKDAETIGVVDNDWVEVYNDHGVVVTRAVVSARIPQGVCIWYHSPERTISIPKSPLRKGRRAGGHNSLTRTRLKPVLMMGGYGQFTFHLNYWGPTGVNRDTHVMVRKLQGEPQF